MGNESDSSKVSSGLPGGFKLPTWGVSPKLNEYIVRGQDLPENLRPYYFGIIELELHLSNLPVGFVQYVRACVNCVSMLVPFLERIDDKKPSRVDHLGNMFINEVNEINVECKGMYKTYRGVDGFTMQMISTTILKQFQEIRSRISKKSRFGGNVTEDE